MDGKKTNVKKGKDEKTNKIRELSLVEEALRIDWTHSVPQCSLTQLDEWYNGAIDAIARDDDVENFKNALKAVHPPIALVSLFQHNRDNFAVCDIIKLAVIRGCRQIVELIIKILGEQKFYEFAQWGKYNCSHIAAIWGHADLIEIFQEYFVKQGGDPSMVPADGSVLVLAQRYGQLRIAEYFNWYPLRVVYQKILNNLAAHLDKAGPQTDPVCTEEDLARYRAGCEEKLEHIKQSRTHLAGFGILQPALSLLASVSVQSDDH
ncbi:uncharacterized protein LOC129601527 isoform X2 [Paramacrobiotus metropolitanus]|uniref:uncharacterized protein LOC129601527 isoform X2 n=1 Tax=Paramacrobiotus metropolitanus TaxID=2943436 RepID=UPI002445ADF5|nr:uncharacterized protein LOC129601527 isoform X2 [Paramacrobiotus metropolitanus]